MAGLHFPLEVTYIGKGPSYKPKELDWSTYPEFRVCVNESYLITPSPSACIGIDREICELWHETEKHYRYMLKMHCFEGERFAFEYRFNPAPQSRYWAAAQGILQLKLLGVERVHMIGFDAFSLGCPVETPENCKTQDLIVPTVLAKNPELWYSKDILELGIPWSVTQNVASYQVAAMQLRECLGETRINIRLRDLDGKIAPSAPVGIRS